MDKGSLAIATISLVRNSGEENLLTASLTVLAGFGLPVFLTDGGSPASFLTAVKALPNVQVQPAKGLWPQAKTSLLAAAASGASTILYTEPDKLDFFSNQLATILDRGCLAENTGVVLASRTAAGFATFPLFQQLTETTINQCCREVIGKDLDYCYGPFLFSATLVPALEALPENCGWGWRPYLFAIAHRKGLTVEAIEGDFVCPPDQREDDETERIYRMKQLTQNLDGLLLATTQVL